MTPYWDDGTVTVFHADALELLRSDVLGYRHDLGYAEPQVADCSVDAVVTDPPYALGFMGAEWDSFGQGVRHFRSNDGAVRLDQPEFRTGRLGAGQVFGAWCGEWADECLRVLKPGGHLLAFGGTRTFHRLVCAVEDAGFEVRDTITWLYAQGWPKSFDVRKAMEGREVRPSPALNVTGPVTADAHTFDGWGTALKPASESIVVARKPLTGSVAANVLEYGTGALNVAGCRVGDSGGTCGAGPGPAGDVYGDGLNGTRAAPVPGLGRWPTNVVLTHATDCGDVCEPDCPVAVLDRQSGVRTSGVIPPGTRKQGKPAGIYGEVRPQPSTSATYGDTGGASRFFPTFRYEPKAPRSERPRNGQVAHPTVKPLDLMRWLVRLVTPPNGLVLDPFAGSGTTGEACVVEGFRCMLVERDADYLPLIAARLSKPIQKTLGL